MLLPRCITIACFACVLAFVLLWGFGLSAWLTALVHVGNDVKGGIPFLLESVPILVAGCACTLLSISTTSSNRVIVSSRSCNWLVSRGDVNPDTFSAVFLLLPVLVYLASSVHRHLAEIAASNKPNHHETSYVIMEVSNQFGMVATMCLGVFLVPVARHSAVLRVLGWSHASAVRLHIWLGRIVILAIAVHGGMYSFSWIAVQKESWWSMVLVPGPCWSGAGHFEPTCRNANSDCGCYDHMRNLTGVVASFGMLLIAITSANSFRRRVYSIFYNIHIIAGPLVLLLVIVHWNRSMVYMVGGLVYYLASSFPVFLENRASLSDGGVRIVSTELIPASRPCVSLTVEATDTALSRYRAGQYVYLYVPEISGVRHPFTINTVPGGPHNNQLRILFRSSGQFTRDLEKFLSILHRPKAPVVLHLGLDGFYGSPHRVQQVGLHDTVLIVAGGIGISPYLSLLHQVHASLCTANNHRTKKIVLHWICRDNALVAYVKKTYFDPLLVAAPADSNNNAAYEIQISIHQTNFEASLEAASTNAPSFHSGDGIEKLVPAIARGVPFAPSKFAAGSKNSHLGNLPSFVPFAFVATISLRVVWYGYIHKQDSEIVWTRLWSPLVVLVVALSVATLSNVLFRCLLRHGEDDGTSSLWKEVAVDDDETELVELVPPLRAQSPIPGPAEALDSARVHLNISNGRPTMEHLVECISGARHPGVFLCGPSALMNEIKRVTGYDQRLWHPQRYLRRRVALYEEHFHM